MPGFWMTKPLPPLNWFRAFEAAARRLSFTAAAQEIGLTQSAVSQQIRAFETRLGVTLFERRARGLALTDEGRKLLPQVDAALDMLVGAVDRYTQNSGENDLTVSASISATEWIISPELPTFTGAHPNVSIRFLTAIWPDEFNATAADVEIRFGSAKQVGGNAVPILPNDLVALKSPRIAGALSDHPLIEAVGVSSGWTDWGEAAGLSDLKPSLYADSYGLALQLAAEGNGVALASSVLAKNALARGVLEVAHENTIPGNEGYFLSVNAEVPNARIFGDWLLETIAA